MNAQTVGYQNKLLGAVAQTDYIGWFCLSATQANIYHLLNFVRKNKLKMQQSKSRFYFHLPDRIL